MSTFSESSYTSKTSGFNDEGSFRNHYTLEGDKESSTKKITRITKKIPGISTTNDAKLLKSVLILAEAVYEQDPRAFLNNKGKYPGGVHDHGIESVAFTDSEKPDSVCLQSYLIATLHDRPNHLVLAAWYINNE
jgi:hypothetical protein